MKYFGVILPAIFFLSVLPSAILAQSDRIATSAGPLVITPIKHASLMLTWNGKVIHVDPWGQGKYQGLPKADIILITHDHSDHLDPAQIGALKKADTVILGPAVIAGKVDGTMILKNGEMKQVGDIEITAVPMYNLTRGPAPGKLYHYQGDGNGYVLNFGGTRVYISGDTECTPAMRSLENIDVAFICMNLPYTMTPAEAVSCIKSFRPKIVFPYHYGETDLKPLVEGLKNEKGIEVRLREWYP
jgi:L-ascorbate metabolism protein UlaG (beta-lactamase superfamily)